MEHVTVRGTSVPALGLGTWRLTGKECQEAVEEALAIGYRHLDTAQMYGNEAEVGAGIAAAGTSHDELFVTTKISDEHHQPDDVRRSTERSLEQLRLDRIDLLLVHHPADPEILDETLATMDRLRDDGFVAHLGVSNFPVDLLERALHMAPLFAIQIEYHPFRDQPDQLEAARRHDLLFQAYSPLARGGVAHDDALQQVADRLGATPAQVTLRWLMDQPNVAAIPKASSREHLEENWAALEVRLDDDARARLHELTDRQLAAADVGD